jgi:hypothetical protein
VLEVVGGEAWVIREIASRFLVRVPCLRRARLLSRYSHTTFRFAHRAHRGFSLVHLILDAAQLLQLSRSLGPVGERLRRA